MAEPSEPKPDPTDRTLAMLYRELTMQNELFDVRLGAFERAHTVMDRTVESVPRK